MNRSSTIDDPCPEAGRPMEPLKFPASIGMRSTTIFWLLIIMLVAATAIAQPHPSRPRHSSSRASIENAALAKDRARVLGANPLALFYYADDSPAATSLRAHADTITLIAPQCFVLDAAGALHGQLPARVQDATLQNGLPVMPLVTNAGFDRSVAQGLLHSAQAQTRAVDSLLQLAQREHYVGWQLDFEGIDPADKLAYTRFVARVAARLHRDHRLLSVAVVPRFSDTFPDSSAPGFHTGEWGAAFDFRALGRLADFLVLMAYDQHTPLTPPGPVAGYDWVNAAIVYAASRVPASKLLLGVPLYGREWIETSQGVSGHSIAYKDLNTYTGNPACDRYWDVLFRTSRFQLRDGDNLRTAWFDDARSLREKLSLVQTYHLRGYAAWRLGMEDPEFWRPLGRTPVDGEQ